MKKGTIATIIGVVAVLGLALTAIPAYASDWIQGAVIYGECYCGYNGDCACRMLLNRPMPCDYDDVLSYIRDLPSYYGEDDDNIYLRATVTTNQYEPDEGGSVFMTYSKTLLQDWVDSGCPAGTL